ncbi:MAG: hypothetical protein ACE5KJ_04265, partial [Candidatus Zixiibacteriota bacterium]
KITIKNQIQRDLQPQNDIVQPALTFYTLGLRPQGRSALFYIVDAKTVAITSITAMTTLTINICLTEPKHEQRFELRNR